LLWEAAEGGTGVWERLLQDKQAFAEIAREALIICHFNPLTGEEEKDWIGRCGPACYDCLLSYANQTEHRYLDRWKVRDYFLQLTQAEIITSTEGRDYEAQYHWLGQRLDPASTLERQFLDILYQKKCDCLIMPSIVLSLISPFRQIFIISGIRFPVSAYSSMAQSTSSRIRRNMTKR